MEHIKDTFRYILDQLLSIRIFDALDILIVAVLLYYIFKFVRDRRAGKLAVGIMLFLLVMFVSNICDMQVMMFLTENIVQVGIIGIIIVFQSELRTFLEKMGGGSLKTLNRRNDSGDNARKIACIDSVVEGACDFSHEKTGALIVFERTTKLGDVIKTGTVINADAGTFLLRNIFFNKAPMHDGALIVRNFRYYSAGCFLPLSLNNDIIKDLGTRHRAAIGMSENSDAVVVIVSEETGTISIAEDGHLIRNLDKSSLKNILVELLIGEENEKSGTFDRMKNSIKKPEKSKNKTSDIG